MPTEPAASFPAHQSGAVNFPEFANERGGCTVEVIGRILVAVIVDPLRKFLRLLSARHITLGFGTVVVVRSYIAERPRDHGSGVDRIASSTFSPRIARKITLSQYRQFLRGHLHRQGQQHDDRYNGRVNPRFYPSKFHDPAFTQQEAVLLGQTPIYHGSSK
jgi:hypothetical protein